MRVLLDVSAVPDRPVGAGVYTIAVAQGLARSAGVELHLLARRGDTRWPALAPGAEVHGDAPPGRPARLVWEQTRAAGIVAELRPDVWHGPHYTLPLRAACPKVTTVHDLTFFDHPEWHERSKVLYFRRMIRASVARADTVICVSEFTARRLHVLCPRHAPVVVIPHGVDHDRFRPESDPAADLAALAEHGIRPPYVAFSGTLEPRKDIPTLVDAFARIAGTHPDLRLVIAGGDGWGTKDVRDAVARSGVATRVLRPGYLGADVIAALFRRAEVVAYPSLEEGFGLPALETMASGTPLVSTNGSAVAEFAGDAAVLVAPGDAPALAAALASVLDDPALAARLRVAGPSIAAAFTWERSVHAHVRAYEAAARAGVRA